MPASGASVIFNSLTGNETINLNGTVTVGTISLTNNSAASVFTLANGTGSVTMDAPTGNAHINIAGGGSKTNVLSASVTLTDTIDFGISNTTMGGVSAGALDLSGSMSGQGGVIKSGAGTMSFTTVDKAYTGSTQINAGVLRVSGPAQMSGTSSVTVNSGAQLNLNSDSATYSFGTGGAAIITLNGDGTASSIGALRFETSATLLNNINLATDSTVHVESGTATVNAAISGAGGLTKSGTGELLLNHSTTFTGATVISAGTLNAATAGALGSGTTGTTAITVNNSGTLLLSGGSGSTDRINNNASVTIDGGGTLNTGGLSEGTRPSAATGGTNGVVGIGALTLNGTSDSLSIIDFATGGSSLVFASLTAASSGAYLQISNWTGVAGSDDGGTGNNRLLFASSDTLTNGDMANFAFDGFGPGGMMIPYGNEFEVVPLSAVPEPATWAAAMLAACAVGYTQRRRLTRLRRQAA